MPLRVPNCEHVHVYVDLTKACMHACEYARLSVICVCVYVAHARVRVAYECVHMYAQTTTYVHDVKVRLS